MVLNYNLNRYFDIVVDPDSIPGDQEEFETDIKSCLEKWKDGKKNAIWLEIPMNKSFLIPKILEIGFEAHHCTKEFIMFTMWLGNEDDVKIPLYGTHIVRVEALLMRNNKLGEREVLVVREKYSNGKKGRDWKLLSGRVEPNEFVNHAIIREIKEEVGLNAEFVNIVGHGNRVSEKFGRNEIFFVCHTVIPKEEEEMSDYMILQKSEIIEAKWMPIREALVEWKNNYKLKGLQLKCLVSALKNKGLVNFVSNDKKNKLLGHFVGIPYCDLPFKKK